MKKEIIIGLLVSLFFCQTLIANSNVKTSADKTVPATIEQFDYDIKNERIFLHWTVSGNQAADKFEVESSADGVKFSSMALVFGTDNDQANEYKLFLRRTKKPKTFRIRITQKDGTVQYHPVVVTVK